MEFNSGLKGLHFFSNGWHYEMNAAEEASLKINHENCAALLESMVLTVTLTHYAFFGDAFAKFRKETISFVMSVC